MADGSDAAAAAAAAETVRETHERAGGGGGCGLVKTLPDPNRSRYSFQGKKNVLYIFYSLRSLLID
jgi:hypothetical protein